MFEWDWPTIGVSCRERNAEFRAELAKRMPALSLTVVPERYKGREELQPTLIGSYGYGGLIVSANAIGPGFRIWPYGYSATAQVNAASAGEAAVWVERFVTNGTSVTKKLAPHVRKLWLTARTMAAEPFDVQRGFHPPPKK